MGRASAEPAGRSLRRIAAVPEILFYSLEQKGLEDLLQGLLERSLERGWRAVVRLDSAERMNALDTHLWTYSEPSFLAHGTPEIGHSSRQPVYLTTGHENPNGASVLFLAGVEAPARWDGREFSRFERVVVLFYGQDAKVAAAARASWNEARRSGHKTALWRQNSAGKWEQQIPA